MLRLLLALLGVTAFAVVGTARAVTPAEDPFARVDSLRERRDIRGAIAVLDSLERSGRSHGDAALVRRACLTRGITRLDVGDGRQAEPDLRNAAAQAKAAHDSTTFRMARGWLGTALMYQGRFDAATAQYERAIPLHVAAGDRNFEAWARTGWSYCRLQMGALAAGRDGYAAATQTFREIHEPHGELTALVGLGIAHLQLGEFADAQAINRQVLERSRALGNPVVEAQAWNNLGAIEFQQGDPAIAIEHYRQAIEIHTRTGELREILTSHHNVAVAMMELGRWDDAAAILDSALAACEGNGMLEARARLLHQLGHVRLLQGRPREALACARQSLQGSDELSIELKARALGDEARALLALGRPAEALHLLESQARGLAPGLGVRDRTDLDVILAEAWSATGRPDEALVRLRQADREAAAAGMVSRRLHPLAAAARCQVALGDTVGALATLREAARVWELQRAVPADPEWRAERGARGREVFAGLARLQLAGELRNERRVRAVFDEIQRFQGRTLAERILGPRPDTLDAGRGITVAEVQKRLLGPGDLLLDAFVGADVSVLFAITRNRCRAVVLPGEDELAPRLRDLRDVLGTPGAGDDGLTLSATAGRAVGEWLLGDVRDLVANSRRILFVPDGPLNMVPLSVLELRVGTGTLRLSEREIAVLPSAALLAIVRRDGGPNPDPARVRVLDGSKGADGRDLPGARREMQGLVRRFAEVSVAGVGSPPESGLAAASVVHVAGHAEVDDQRPWRSSFALGNDRHGQPVRLSAADVAMRRLHARLAVLAGCRSAGGRVLSGEGVQGLTAAFMGAGVPCVVASLWPVDDAATQRLVTSFYESLARGRTAGAALVEAQRLVRGRVSTQHPFYWAGFVVVGDPDVTVPLRARRHWPAAAIALVPLLLLLWWVAVNRRPRIPVPAAGL